MEALKYVIDKKVYLLINLIILGLGYYLIEKGMSPIVSSKSNVYVAIGTSLIATGIVVFLDLWKNLFISKLLEKIKVIINEAGVDWIYKKRDIDKYDELINDMKDSLDICGYSLGGFFDSYSEKIKEKIQAKNVIVRVIFVQPNTEPSKTRAEIEGKSAELFNERFESFKAFFKNLKGIEIRTLNFALSSMIYRIDNKMFIGPHFYKRQSKSTLTMELSKGKWMFEEYQKEFDRMWDDATLI